VPVFLNKFVGAVFVEIFAIDRLHSQTETPADIIPNRQAYVMDTGVRTSHRLFDGRARNLGGLASTDKSPYCDETMDDTNGHGTQ
jgi:hypothetical protein